MPRHRRGQKPLRRSAPRRDALPRFVIFCEGELTEPRYLKAYASLPEARKAATLDIRGLGYEPRRLVEEARTVKRSDRGQATGPTEYWCVFDVEAPTQHARLHDAVQMARDNGISSAISNPCFELWLVLHHADHESWIANDDCRALRRQYDSSQGKGVDAAAFMPRRGQAIRRAKRLATMHTRADRQLPADNPSSGMYQLLEAVESTTDER